MPDPEAGAERLWDLSMLLIDGSPVSQKAVVDWLNLAYIQTYAAPYNPEAFQSFQETPLMANRLYQLLGFADAVGSPKGLVSFCGPALLKSLVLPVQLGQQVIDLQLDGSHSYSATGLQLEQWNPGNHYATSVGQPAASQEDLDAFKCQSYSMIEQLFLLSFKLEVRALQLLLYTFLRSQTQRPNGIFNAHVNTKMTGMVFSERVVVAATHNEASRHMWAAALIECPHNIFSWLAN
eukprot:gene3467-3739_t